VVVSDGEVPPMGSIGCHFNANLPTSYIVFGSFFLTMLRSVVAARLTARGDRSYIAIPDEEKNDAAVRLREFRGLAPKLFFGGTGSPKSH
jgi:hypothetical protein